MTGFFPPSSSWSLSRRWRHHHFSSGVSLVARRSGTENMNASPTVNGPVIRTEGFAFSYPGSSVPAVSDLTFAVQRHEIFGFLGPSGAGKSTTQNVLIG